MRDNNCKEYRAWDKAIWLLKTVDTNAEHLGAGMCFALPKGMHYSNAAFEVDGKLSKVGHWTAEALLRATQDGVQPWILIWLQRSNQVTPCWPHLVKDEDSRDEVFIFHSTLHMSSIAL